MPIRHTLHYYPRLALDNAADDDADANTTPLLNFLGSIDIEPMLLLQKGREKAVKQTEKVVADAEEEDSQQVVFPLEGDPSEVQEDGAEAAEADVEPRQADAEGSPVNDENEAVFEDDDEDDDSDEDETV